MNRSTAAMSGAWLCKRVRNPWLGGPRRLTMYLATLDCATSNASLVNAWRAPKRILHAHPPDHRAASFRSAVASLWARLPTPVAAKAGLCHPHECLGAYDCEYLHD